jgi:hypothetical protein
VQQLAGVSGADQVGVQGLRWHRSGFRLDEAVAVEEQTVARSQPDLALGELAGLVAYYAQLEQTATSDARQGLDGGTVFLQAGSDLMHQPGAGVLSQVDALRDIYVASMRRADLTLQIATALLAAYAVVAVAVFVVLIHTQIFVRARFRRRRKRGRGVPEPAASLTAEVGIALFRVTFERWLDGTDDRAFGQLLLDSLEQLKAVIVASAAELP